MLLLVLLLSSQAFGHGGRTIDGEQGLFPQVMLGLGLLLTGWGMVHFSSRTFHLPARDIRTKGKLPLGLASVSTVLFALLCWVSVKPAGLTLPVLIETREGWEVHHPGGLHSETTLLLEAGKPVKLQLETENGTRFQVPALGVDVEVKAGEKRVVNIDPPQAGTHETNVEGLFVQVLPEAEYEALIQGEP
ncbi:hypothetical protein [Deinococcus cellulosilyticus]|uniref:Uncharacterized protein n=1 Tax=Deinococcus cellulosilyticus (strain DSM 18568 / NBRC 106333 / KACC 11606 / 5516J-15) TaxID=1223518 RepID=A0A511N9M7_DEIC1|nr:hypothetical protein [Deinococcus cellulosilyticus]GEM49534.1 hypothetical protein DC3_51690 [Deinococcus cellulosilyticus NBRC 106333 = KACC 11606]